MARSDTTSFDRWAPDYDSSALQQLVYSPAHAAVLAHCARAVPAPRRVLDLGCGTGRLLRAAASRFPGADLVGLDVSAGMLAVAAADRRLRLVRAAAESLPFATASFDVVTATLTYRHWSDQLVGLAEARRVLTARGVLAMATVAVTVGRRRPLPRRRSGPPASLVQALHAAGLRVVHRSRVIGAGPLSEIAIVLARPRHR